MHSCETKAFENPAMLFGSSYPTASKFNFDLLSHLFASSTFRYPRLFHHTGHKNHKESDDNCVPFFVFYIDPLLPTPKLILLVLCFDLFKSFAPSLGYAVALGYVRSEFAEEGTRITVRERRGLSGTVVKLPFFREGSARKPLSDFL